MSKYKVHVYILKEEPYDHNQYVYVRRENLETGNFEMLRAGATTWPESIVKTCLDADVPASLYMITEEQLDMGEWDQAKLIPERDW